MGNTFNIKDYFKKLPVLDKGHVELIDGMALDPKLKIVNAARVSFHKESYELSDKDIKLINRLYKDEHFSTFRHSYFSFRIKAPLFVFRQWWKYQIGSEWIEDSGVGSIEIPDTSWNEQSGRYTEFEPEFYIPKEIRKQSKNNKQGSEGILDKISIGIMQMFKTPVEFFEESCKNSYKSYKILIDNAASKEVARMLLPVNIYSECIWTCSLQTILYFLHQRLKPEAQEEIREYAIGVFLLIKPMLEAISDLLPIS